MVNQPNMYFNVWGSLVVRKKGPFDVYWVNLVLVVGR